MSAFTLTLFHPTNTEAQETFIFICFYKDLDAFCMYFARLEMLDESALKHFFPSSDLQMNHMGSLLKAKTVP